MRKKLFTAGCVLTLALFSVASAHAVPTCSDALGALFTPAPISLASCIACTGSYSTSPGGGASHWGFGSTCSAALTDLTNQTKAAANNYCLSYIDDYPSCNFAVVITGGCTWTGSQYRYDGFANFSCKVWVVGPGCPRP